MLDIKYIRQNPDKVKQGTLEKGYKADVIDKLLKIDGQRLKLLLEVEELRAKQNVITNDLKTSKSKDFLDKELIEKASVLKRELKLFEPELDNVEKEFNKLMLDIPNPPAADVPKGKGESENVELKVVGDKQNFKFKSKDHLELAEKLDIIDFERGAKVAGSGFYYLKGDGLLLELALVRYGIEFLSKKGFTPMFTPDLARSRYYLGTGFQPRGPEAQIYTIDETDLGLIATAEVTLAGYHADETLPAAKLPLKYAGYSHCYRKEAGSYGQYSKGLYRVHQFTKVEMFIYCTAPESVKIHEELLQLEEEFWQSLEISYRVLEMCAGDLGAQAVKKYDLEAWMPGRGDWGEITTTSNTTDFQARRLGIKYRDNDKTQYVHTLNGTLVATSRGIIAILENNQQEDGSVLIPKVLQQYMGKEVIK